MKPYSMRGTLPLTANSSLQCRMDGAEDMARYAWAARMPYGTPETGYVMVDAGVAARFRGIAADLATDVLNDR